MFLLVFWFRMELFAYILVVDFHVYMFLLLYCQILFGGLEHVVYISNV